MLLSYKMSKKQQPSNFFEVYSYERKDKGFIGIKNNTICYVAWVGLIKAKKGGRYIGIQS